VIRGASAVAEQALGFAQRLGPFTRPALVNGAAGIVAAQGGQPVSVLGFTVRRGKIVEIDILADRARLRQLDLAVLDHQRAAPRPRRRDPTSRRTGPNASMSPARRPNRGRQEPTGWTTDST
jgi:hypothetical protein